MSGNRFPKGSSHLLYAFIACSISSFGNWEREFYQIVEENRFEQKKNLFSSENEHTQKWTDMEELGALNIVYHKKKNESIFIKINMGWLTDNKDELCAHMMYWMV